MTDQVLAEFLNKFVSRITMNWWKLIIPLKTDSTPGDRQKREELNSIMYSNFFKKDLKKKHKKLAFEDFSIIIDLLFSHLILSNLYFPGTMSSGVTL